MAPDAKPNREVRKARLAFYLTMLAFVLYAASAFVRNYPAHALILHGVIAVLSWVVVIQSVRLIARNP